VQNYLTIIFSPLQPTGKNFKNFIIFITKFKKWKKIGQEDAEMIKVLQYSSKNILKKLKEPYIDTCEYLPVLLMKITCS
jgi:hypothetical protein